MISNEENEMRPYAELIGMVKRSTRYSDKFLAELILHGRQRLAERDRREKPNQFDMFKRVYEDEFPSDVPRALRDLKKLTVTDLRNNEKALKKFGMYCSMISEGMETQTTLHEGKQRGIQADIAMLWRSVEEEANEEARAEAARAAIEAKSRACQ